eukprot:UN12219
MAQVEKKEENMDTLNLGNEGTIQLLIQTEGLGVKEKVVFSEEIVKINRKGRRQNRYLMLTNYAMYNIKPKQYQKSKRRVAIRDIGMLTLSAISPEFAIHVPSEYDYHYESKNKDKIAELFKRLYAEDTNSKLLVVYSELRHLKDIILTKTLSKFENRNSKHAIKETMISMKDVLEEIDQNQYEPESTSDSNDIIGHSDDTEEDEDNHFKNLNGDQKGDC